MKTLNNWIQYNEAKKKAEDDVEEKDEDLEAVSYTHLTLPTIYSV